MSYDHVLRLRAYNTERDDQGEAVDTLLFDEEVWAHRLDGAVAFDFTDFLEDHADPQNLGSWVIRYDPRLLDVGRVTIEWEGLERRVGQITLRGRRYEMVLAD